jgi:hypothetical protein
MELWFSKEDIVPYSVLRSSLGTGDQVSTDSDLEWSLRLGIHGGTSRQDFALWPELYTGGSFNDSEWEREEYRGGHLNPLVPLGGIWETPYYYDCRDRTSGTYPTYLLLAMSIIGMTATILLDPRCGITEEATAFRSKFNKQSMWLLVMHGGANDGREYFVQQHNGMHGHRHLLEMPKEGVVNFRASIGAAFERGYARAKLTPKIDVRQQELESMGKLSQESKWTLWTNGERDCFERLGQDMTRSVYSLQMPEQGVSQIVGELGQQFEARYTQASLTKMPPDSEREPEAGREPANVELVPRSATTGESEQGATSQVVAPLKPQLAHPTA